jgi:hypothetical protein
VEEAAPQVEEAAPVEEEAAPQVEEAAPQVEEAAVEEEAAPEEEEAPEEEAQGPEEEEAPQVEEAPVEEEEQVEEAPAPVEESSSTQVEQVASDIRDILAPVVTEVNDSSSSSELSDELKQRIAELDYLRECCGNWVGKRRQGKSEFLTAWKDRSVTVDSNVNYEDVLVQLEKMPEIIKLWIEKKVTTESNHFKNIESYTLQKPLFNDKSVSEKLEVLEQLIGLMNNCANGTMKVTKEVIDNLC